MEHQVCTPHHTTTISVYARKHPPMYVGLWTVKRFQEWALREAQREMTAQKTDEDEAKLLLELGYESSEQESSAAPEVAEAPVDGPSNVAL